MQAMQQSLAQQVAGLANVMTAPKRVVRDPVTNKVIGVEPVIPVNQPAIEAQMPPEAGSIQ
jgi:hypothetical protein